MNITYNNNHWLTKFFHKNKDCGTIIKQDISTRLIKLIAEDSHKIKRAQQLQYQGRDIFEYKVAMAKNRYCRVAYTQTNEQVEVLFISEKIIKRVFCDLLRSTALVD